MVEAGNKIKQYRDDIESKDISVEIKPINRAKYLGSLKAANPDYTVKDIINVEFMLSE